MGWLTIVLILALVYVVFKHKKHELHKKSIKFLIFGVFLFLILSITAYYVDIEKVFNKDNTVSKTGAAVVETVKDTLETPKLFTDDNYNHLVNKLDKSMESFKNS